MSRTCDACLEAEGRHFEIAGGGGEGEGSAQNPSRRHAF